MPYGDGPYGSITYAGVLSSGLALIRSVTDTAVAADNATFTDILHLPRSASDIGTAANISVGGHSGVGNVQVQISLTTPFAMPTWVDVTTLCLEFDTQCGKQHALDRMETGTFNGTFDNRSGQFNPWYFNGQSAILPVQIPLRVVAPWNGVSYPIFWGLIDSCRPSTPDELNSETTITASDLLKYLSNTYISSNYYSQQVLATSGLLAYYRLSEAQGSGNAIHDMTGNGYTGRIGGQVTFGAPGEILYDTDTACDLANSTINPGGYLVMPTSLTSAVGSSWSVEVWCAANEASTKSAALLGNLSNATFWQLVAFPGTAGGTLSGGTLNNFTIGVSGGAFAFNSGNAQCNVLDGNWHHVVLTQTPSGGTTTTLYVDGVQVQQTSQGSTSPQNFWSAGGQLTVGLSQSTATPQPSFPGIVDEVAVYNSAMSSGDVAAHFDAGQWFYNSDYSGDRIAQVLTVIGVPPSNWGGSAGTHGGTIAKGRVQMANAQDGVASAGGTPLALTDQSALDYIQTVETTEVGSFYQLPSGALAFRDQYYVYTNPTSNVSQIVLADQAPDSTYPYHYLPGIQIVIDDQDIWNVIQVQPVNGIEQTVYNQGSINQFGYRLQQDLSGILTGTQQQALNLANLLLLQYAYPLIRIQQMDMASWVNNGATMPSQLGMYLLDSFSVVRQAQVGVPLADAYPQASGYTHPDTVADPPTPDYSTEPGRFVVESIKHKVTTGTNASSGDFMWQTTWVGSPYEIQGYVFYLKLDSITQGFLDINTLGP